MQVSMMSAADCKKVVILLQSRGMPFAPPSRSTRTGTVETELRPPSTTVDSALEVKANAPYNLRSRGSHKDPSLIRGFSPQYQKGQLHLGSQSGSSSKDVSNGLSAYPFLVRDEVSAPRTLTIDHSTPSQMFAAPQLQAVPRSHSQFDSAPAFSSLSNISSSDLKSFSDQLKSSRELQQSHHHVEKAVLLLREKSDAVDEPSLQLPPPRELPFKRTGSERSHSSSLSLQPLPKPRPADGRASLPLPQGADASSMQPAAAPKRRHSELDAPDSEESLDAKRAMLPPARPSSSLSRSSPKTMAELLYGKAPRVDRAEDLDGPRHAVKRAATEGGAAESESQGSRNSLCLTNYVKLDDKQRTRAIEQFMMRMLGNVDFAKLCEDLSACWQHLGQNL